jgi:hypothetical protein
MNFRVSSQLGFKVSDYNSPVKAPTGPIHITYRVFFPEFIANGDIEHRSTGPISISKNWTEKWHVYHLAQRYVKYGNLLGQYPHALKALNGVDLLQLSKLVLIEL